MKTIKVKFQSAKVPVYFDANRKVMHKMPTLLSDIKQTTDRINGNEERPKEQLISVIDCGNKFGTADNLIHIEQVSNMLHVLLGERPVKSFNNITNKKRISIIDEIAKNGYVKLNNIFKCNYKDKDGQEKIKYISESNSFKKGNAKGANYPGEEIITWRRFRNRFVDEPDDIEKYITVIGKYTSKPFDENHYGSVTEALKDIEKNNKLNDLVNEKVLPNGFFNNTLLRPISSTRLACKTVNSTPMSVISLDGEFIFNLPDELYDRITCGKKMATYLDGGLATLEKWNSTDSYENNYINETDILDENFEKIKDIDIRKNFQTDNQ